MLYVCNKGGNHLFDGPHIFLATACTSSALSQCDGIMVLSQASRDKFGVKDVDYEALRKALGALPKGTVTVVPIRRVDADGFKKKEAVWTGNRERGKRSVYFRCLSCFAINTIAPHTPPNISVDGTVYGCEICVKCMVHQFIQLAGWADYLAEAPMPGGRKHDD